MQYFVLVIDKDGEVVQFQNFDNKTIGKHSFKEAFDNSFKGTYSIKYKDDFTIIRKRFAYKLIPETELKNYRYRPQTEERLKRVSKSYRMLDKLRKAG